MFSIKKRLQKLKNELTEVYGHRRTLKFVSNQQNLGKNCFAKMAAFQQKVLGKET